MQIIPLNLSKSSQQHQLWSLTSFYSTQNISKLKIKQIKKIFFSEISDILTIFRVYSSVHGIPAPQPFAARTESTYRRSRNVAFITTHTIYLHVNT